MNQGEAVMLSQEVEKVVERAMGYAQTRRHEFATVEHLCLALFEQDTIRNLLKKIGINRRELQERFIEYIEHQIETLPDCVTVTTQASLGFQRVLQRAYIHIMGAGKEEVNVEHVLVACFDEEESHAVFMMLQQGLTRLDLVSLLSQGGLSEPGSDSIEDEDEAEDKSSALSRYTLCLTDEARLGRLDAVIGRDRELDRAIQVLSRRRKNNPLFVGEPGVGKTALAEALAQRIVAGLVPDYLADAEVYLLDMGAMLAGARYRGDFENRMKAVLRVMESKKNAMLVIDEIHTVVGAGATSGSSMDASNLLKPILSKGTLRCIGSTTYKEYRQYFEKDRALARRFQKIDIDEPSDAECIEILQGIKKRYEDYHEVAISDESLGLAVELSKRYLHERKLPDKAIDLIDEACARLRLIKNQQQDQGIPLVDAEAIHEAVATMAQIPEHKVGQDDKKLLQNLEYELKSKIFGQDSAIDEVVNAILLSRAGLRDQEKPIGSFLFTGPSGVGKTEVAKQLAQALGNAFIRFDMSEYMERHAASRLVGAPPGYVGFEQGGLLTDAVHKTPYAVLLLDEIEKAHPDVFNLLLQVMDYGRLTDSNGRSADFRHVILIMTSNLGARELERQSIGFVDDGKRELPDAVVSKFFSPEFRNRLDARVSFAKLSPEVVGKVVDKFMAEVRQKLREKNIDITITPSALLLLARLGFDDKLGARPLARIIQDKIKKPLARELLFGELKEGMRVEVDGGADIELKFFT